MTLVTVMTRAFARQVQAERAWLYDHLGRDRADAFEAELAHALDLLEAHPEMGDARPAGSSAP